MLVACGIACLLVGLVCVVGQTVSAVNFPLAQRLGLQESAEDTEPLFGQLELNTARWDLVVLWTLPAVGVLMLLGHRLWPHLALVAGGIYLDTGGREIAKLLALRAHSVRIGTRAEFQKMIGFLTVLSVTGAWAIAMAAMALLGAERVS